MGTTVTAAKVGSGEVSFGHVGDSRAYRLRDGELEQITRDHSLYEQLKDGGVAVPPLAEFSYGNVITRALGPQAEERPELHRIELKSGDRLLLCTDGLTRHVRDEEIEAELRSPRTSQETCQRLVQLALDRGAEDNVTVVVGRLKNKPQGV